MFDPFLRAWLEGLPCVVTGYLNIRQSLLQPESIQELPHRWVSTADEGAEGESQLSRLQLIPGPLVEEGAEVTIQVLSKYLAKVSRSLGSVAMFSRIIPKTPKGSTPKMM